MKKLIPAVIIIIFLSSCSRYVIVGDGTHCKVKAPRKFENDRAWKRNYNWVNNPRSGRYRSGF